MPGRFKLSGVAAAALLVQHLRVRRRTGIAAGDASDGERGSGGSAALPNVTFVRQVSFACNGTMPAEIGYKEQVSDLGVVAHIGEMGDGLHLLVCQGQTPFELRVDAATPAIRRDAAIALAREVLAGS